MSPIENHVFYEIAHLSIPGLGSPSVEIDSAVRQPFLPTKSRHSKKAGFFASNTDSKGLHHPYYDLVSLFLYLLNKGCDILCIQVDHNVLFFAGFLWKGVRLILRSKLGKMMVNEERPELFPAIA